MNLGDDDDLSVYIEEHVAVVDERPITSYIDMRLVTPTGQIVASAMLPIHDDGQTIWVMTKSISVPCTSHGTIVRIEFELPHRFGTKYGYQDIYVGYGAPGATVNVSFKDNHRLIVDGLVRS